MGIIEYVKESRELIASIKGRDPAAPSAFQIKLLYSGYRAVMNHRKAHWFQKRGFYFIARYISQRTRHKTGIEIHPGAVIGRNLFIDHGMGVVIGETSEIGDNCTIYQGVTLGGTGNEKDKKRHPTLGDNVFVGSGAKILGAVKIGSGSKIGANAVVIHDLPENATAVGPLARIVRIEGVKIPDEVDPLGQEICAIKKRLHELERGIKKRQE